MQKRWGTYHIYLLLFFISGFAGLIYESLWAQYLKILIGHAAFAQSFVLVVFLVGLSVGSWFGGKIVLRNRRLLLFYGLAEAGIGILALAFHPCFGAVNHLVFHSSLSVGHGLLTWALIFLLTFPSTVLLGATFPLLAAALQKKLPAQRAKVVSYLYFLNSLGAAIGILATGFLFIPWLGLPETLIVAGAINLLVALVAILYSTKAAPSHDFAVELPQTSKPAGKSYSTAIFLSALFTGTASMIYEIGWIRLLSMVLGSSAHAFELMLSAFIFGLALGSWWMTRKIDKLKSQQRFIIRVQLMMGMLAILSLLVYNQSFAMMEYLMSRVSRDETGYLIFNIGSNLLGFMVMLPATILAGTTLPLMIDILQNSGRSEQVIGKVYAMNTLGGIAGVVLAVHFLMPFLGLRFLMIIAGALDMAVGVWLMVVFKERFNVRLNPFIAASAVVLTLTTFFFHLDPVKMCSGIFRYGNIDRDKEVLFYRDGKTASIAVAQTSGGSIVLTTNGKPDASINTTAGASGDEATQTLLAALPLALNSDVEQVAIVGLGSGKTAHVSLMNDKVSSVDVIEIEQAVAGAVSYFRPYVDNIFNDYRFRLYIDDARNFLAFSPKKYDLIISEPSNPWVSGMSGLFSDEFYQIIQSALTTDGMFVQWMHLYEMNMPLIASVIKAFSPHFADYHLYFLDDGDMVIIGKKGAKLKQVSSLIFDNLLLQGELSKLGIESKNDLALRYIGDKHLFDPFFFSYPKRANSDFYPILEYEAPKARFINQSANGLMELLTFTAPVLKSLHPTPFTISNKLSRDYAFSLSQKYRDAQTIYHIALEMQNKHEVTFSELDSYLALLVRNVFLINSPSRGEILADGWHEYLQPFAGVVMPFLPPARLDSLWNFIENAPGYEFLSKQIKAEIQLYHAAGNRDYTKILALTTSIQNHPPNFISPVESYKYTVALWAFIMTRQYDAAGQMLKNCSDDQVMPVMVRLLKACYVSANYL